MAGTIRMTPAGPAEGPPPGFTGTQAPRKRLTLDLSPDADELLGVTLGGRYQVQAVLGQGGMGTVYHVKHAVLGRAFALKVLRREIVVDPESVRRFMQEARVTASIEHANMIEVIDFGEVTEAELPSLKRAKQPYFVMELLQGETLADVIARQGSVAPEQVAAVFAEVASALSAAHERGVVHRDLKPDNVFLVSLGAGKCRAKVLDFGVAKLLSGAKLTRKGTVFGTPYYMSPEQASGGDIDGRADQYALGVVMYEALSGRVPFDDDNHMGVMTKHIFAEPEPIQVVVPDPARLGALGPIVMRCLQKRVEARFATTAELAAALSALAGGGSAAVSAPKPGTLSLRAPDLGEKGQLGRVLPTIVDTPGGRPVTSSRARLFGVVAGLLAVIAGGLGVLVMAQSSSPAPKDAASATAERPAVTSAAAVSSQAATDTAAAVAPGSEAISASALPSAQLPTPAASASERPSTGGGGQRRPTPSGGASIRPAPTTAKTVDPNVW